MKRRRNAHLRKRRRRIDPAQLPHGVSVERFAELTHYSPAAIYRKLHRGHLTGYFRRGRWLVPYPPIGSSLPANLPPLPQPDSSGE
ncbi:MAG: hypothetical protein AAFX78_16275 [Cyanobacteria bacterium J06638_20]